MTVIKSLQDQKLMFTNLFLFFKKLDSRHIFMVAAFLKTTKQTRYLQCYKAEPVSSHIKKQTLWLNFPNSASLTVKSVETELSVWLKRFHLSS